MDTSLSPSSRSQPLHQLQVVWRPDTSDGVPAGNGMEAVVATVRVDAAVDPSRNVVEGVGVLVCDGGRAERSDRAGPRVKAEGGRPAIRSTEPLPQNTRGRVEVAGWVQR